MDVQVLVRGRFFDVPGATATKIASNVWEVTVPRNETVAKRARRPLTVEGWDGAVFLIGEEETEPAMVSRETKTAFVLTALVF